MAKKRKNKKETMWAVFILAIFLLALYVLPQKTKACFGTSCFKVEVVTSDKDLSIGLMYRESMKPNEGMLFVFGEESPYSFWMRNTLIPLDIIWLDKDKKVVYIKENAQPCRDDLCETFKPEKSAKYVLEINANASKEADIKVGDIIRVNIP